MRETGVVPYPLLRDQLLEQLNKGACQQHALWGWSAGVSHLYGVLYSIHPTVESQSLQRFSNSEWLAHQGGTSISYRRFNFIQARRLIYAYNLERIRGSEEADLLLRVFVLDGDVGVGVASSKVRSTVDGSKCTYWSMDLDNNHSKNLELLVSYCCTTQIFPKTCLPFFEPVQH